jgi:hypothetical protein
VGAGIPVDAVHDTETVPVPGVWLPATAVGGARVPVIEVSDPLVEEEK